MKQPSIDILMITYNRPHYTRLSLQQLLDTCDETMRVWIWHNGDDEPTLEVVRSLASHPRVHEFYISPVNKKLNEPTNWLWANAKGDYFSKVDDDCLVPKGWAQTLRQAHEDVPEFGIIACWHFLEEDFISELAFKKIKEFSCGHRLMQNCWVCGSGTIMKRECIKMNGLLINNSNFSEYAIKLAQKSWINGWYYPFIYQEHMDDPRTPHTRLKTEDDFKLHKPLTAINFNVLSRDEWIAWLHRDARNLQKAPIDPRYYLPWRRRMRKLLILLTDILRKQIL